MTPPAPPTTPRAKDPPISVPPPRPSCHRISVRTTRINRPEPRFRGSIEGDAMKNRKKNQDGKGLGRREFLKVSLAAGASLAAPMIFTRSASAQQERVLKIVQW